MANESDAPRLSKLQQHRSRETRSKLIDAAVGLWESHGFDDTTIDAICEAAGVSKGGFYFHFAQKEDLLLEIGAAAADGLWEEWTELAQRDDPTEHAARAFTKAIVRDYTAIDRVLLGRIIIEVFGAGARWSVVRGDRRDLIDISQALVERGQRRGELSGAYSAAELGTLLAMLMLEGTLTWLASGESSLHTILWRRIDLLLKGAATPPRVLRKARS